MCNCGKTNGSSQATIEGAKKMADSLQKRVEDRKVESVKKIPTGLAPSDRCPYCGAHKWYYCNSDRGCIITGLKPA